MKNVSSRMWLLFVVIAFVILRLPSALTADGSLCAKGLGQQANRGGPDILLQGFTWNSAVNGQKYVWYRTLESKAEDLAQAGVTHVWFPPPARSVSPQGYMPGDYYDLGSGDALGDNRTLYGNEAELKRCVATFKRFGIQSLADIVVNHRCASHQENGVWNIFHSPSGKALWEKWAVARGDYNGTGQPDTGADFAAAPDLDHTNPKVRQDIVDWLLWLKGTIGFDGWRFDYVKGYGAQFVGEYIGKSQPAYAVGEYWTSMDYTSAGEMLPDQNAHRQRLCDWVNGTGDRAAAFDFTTKGLLQEACRRNQYWRLKDNKGKAAGMIGWWPEKSVTFIDNHDTGSSQNHWPFPGDRVLAGYAYILTHPGTPSIFWDHLYAWGQDTHDRIKKMAQLRGDMRIHRGSSLNIITADNSRYVACVDGKLTLVLGDTGPGPGTGWTQRLSGPGYSIWIKN